MIAFGSFALMTVLLVASAGATTTVTRIGGADYGLACPTRTLCYTLGNSKAHGELITVAGHRETRHQAVAKARYLYDISCPSSRFCLAVGTTSSDHGILVNVRHGTVADQVVLPWIPTLVACPAADRCVIAGGARHVATAIEVALTSGTSVRTQHKSRLPASAKQVNAEALSCASLSACELLGETQPSSGPHDFLESVGAGATPGRPQFSRVLNTFSGAGLACPLHQDTCYVTGLIVGFSGGALYSVRIGGTSLTRVSTYSGTLYQLACVTLARCTGAGDSSSSTGTIVVPFMHGHPGHATHFHMPQLSDGGGFRAVAMGSTSSWTAIGGSKASRKTTLVRGRTP